MDENRHKDDISVDELIRSLHEEIDRCDEMMQTPKKKFQPTLPKEYAELDAHPKKRKKDGIGVGKKTFIYVAGVLVASVLLAVFAWDCADDVCAFTRRDSTVYVTVQPSDTVDEIADTLYEKGLIAKKWLFRLYCTVAKAEKKILPGTYELNTVFDYHALVNGMASAALRTEVSVTIPEGFTMAEIFALLEEKGVCRQEELRACAAQANFDYPFLRDVPAGDANRLEGCLFPDTYFFYAGDDATRVLDKMLANLNSKLTTELWTALDELNADLAARKRSGGFTEAEIAEGTLSMYDILTVASLIEKETSGSLENTMISSVIYNRLCGKAYPFLNIDATIQYALSERKEKLTDADKEIDSPYNTYKNMGLPKGPIACPGLLAIRGALYPQSSNYHFYALSKDGTHHFSRTYEEHLAFLASNG